MLINGIENIHFEPTARCNAGCPMCSRTNNPEILNNQGEITFDQFRKYFPQSFISKLKKFKFCGNYGDPAAAKDLLKFHEYIYSFNPNIEFILSTNGGLRNEKFWQQLAAYYQGTRSHVQFHIDGLEDTNHIYRVGVRWDVIIRNVKAFTQAGGNGKWYWIPFFHNEHQIEEAEKLSPQLGLSEFIIKVSARFKDGSKPFEYDNGKRIYPPVADRFRFEKFQSEGKLQCVSELRKEIYVDAWGKLWPCCWTASAARRNPHWIIDNDLSNRSIEEILSDPVTDTWVNDLYSKSGSVCNQRCTGKYIHIIDRKGKQVPQKDYWLVE